MVKEESTLAKVKKEVKEEVVDENEENEGHAQRSLRKRKSAPVYSYNEDEGDEEGVEEEASKVKKTKKVFKRKLEKSADKTNY